MSLKEIKLSAGFRKKSFEEDITTSQKVTYPQLFDVEVYFHQLEAANEPLQEFEQNPSRFLREEKSVQYDFSNETLGGVEESMPKSILAKNSSATSNLFPLAELYNQISSNNSYEQLQEEPTQDISPKVLGISKASVSLEENLIEDRLFYRKGSNYNINSNLESKMFSYTPWHLKEPPRPSNSYYSTTSQRMPTLKYYRR